MDRSKPDELRLKAYAELASYSFPKLRPIDVFGQQNLQVINVKTNVHTATAPKEIDKKTEEPEQ